MSFLYPSTPKELMQSRYDAFVRGDGVYLAETTTQKTSTDMSAYSNITWLKLEILNAYDDIVEFKAYYKENDKIFLLHEKSRFVKVDGRWKYQDGEIFNTPIKRNELCPCGSGKKFKRCCSLT